MCPFQWHAAESRVWRKVRVPKADLGQKRVCGNCAAKFYDLGRNPIICPKCGTEFDLSAVVKPRRARAVAEEKPAKPVKKVPKLAEVAVAELPEGDTDDAVVVDDDEEEEGVIEDASELGEDEDDMAEVIENVDEDPER
jgi:uncharacterized protein (TIGR02300 family)